MKAVIGTVIGLLDGQKTRLAGLLFLAALVDSALKALGMHGLPQGWETVVVNGAVFFGVVGIGHKMEKAKEAGYATATGIVEMQQAMGSFANAVRILKEGSAPEPSGALPAALPREAWDGLLFKTSITASAAPALQARADGALEEGGVK